MLTFKLSFHSNEPLVDMDYDVQIPRTLRVKIFVMAVDP